MTRPPRASRRQVAAATSMLDALLTLSPLIDNGELCRKRGVIGQEEYLCRYPRGHIGMCTWRLQGAVEMLGADGKSLEADGLDAEDFCYEPDVAGSTRGEG